MPVIFLDDVVISEDNNGFSVEDFVEYVNDRPGHDYRYSMDSSKIRNELGWTPKIKFGEGLENTISWYLKNKKWWKDIPQDVLIPNWQK